MEDKQPTHQGEYLRFKLLATMSEVILHIDSELSALRTDNRFKNIKTWFQKLAEQTLVHFETTAGPNSRRNNHRYWAALAVINTAIINQDETLFNWAKDSFYIALNEIDSSALLPLEYARGKYALKYHYYALSPLVHVADKLSTNNIQLSDTEIKKFRKLIQSTFIGYFSPTKDQHFTNEQREEVSVCVKAIPILEVYLKDNSLFSSDPNVVHYKKLLLNYRKSCTSIYSTDLGGNQTYLHGKKY